MPLFIEAVDEALSPKVLSLKLLGSGVQEQQQKKRGGGGLGPHMGIDRNGNSIK